MGSNKKEKAFWAEATVERPISEVCAHGFGRRIKTAGLGVCGNLESLIRDKFGEKNRDQDILAPLPALPMVWRAESN